MAAALSSQVKNDKDFYNAFMDDSVGAIGLSYDGASLAPYAQALYNYVSVLQARVALNS